MQRIGDLANYARSEHGGARLAWRIDETTGGERGRVKDSSRPMLVSPIEVAVLITAGRFWQRLCQPEAFSTVDWQTLRLPGEDSSISARMACRSSVAEITGNRRISTPPRAQTNTSGHTAGLFAGLPVPFRRCHSSHAGSSREIQQRLRKSSIQNARVSPTRQHQHNPVQLPQDNQDSTSTASDLRT